MSDVVVSNVGGTVMHDFGMRSSNCKFVSHVDITVDDMGGITIIVISGKTGSGKTTVAHSMADYFGLVGNMSSVWMASKRDADDYAGQDVVVFDDVPNALEIVDDWKNKDPLIGRFRVHEAALPAVVIITETR